MQHFIDFFINHWALWTALIVILALFAGLELQSQLRGIPQLSPQEVTHLINHQEGLVLDIRHSTNFIKGHILGAKNIVFDEINAQLANVESYKAKPIIVVAEAAQQQQAIKTAVFLRKQGFSHTHILRGGIGAWRSASLPLAK